MFAPQVVFDPAAAQIRTGEGVRDGALFRDDSDVFSPIYKNAVACEQFVAFIETWPEVIEEFFELRDEIFRQIADLPAHARVGGSETRASEQLEKVIEFFALSECVEEDCHRA